MITFKRILKLIDEKGDSLKGNRFIESVTRQVTGRPLEYWLSRKERGHLLKGQPDK